MIRKIDQEIFRLFKVNMMYFKKVQFFSNLLKLIQAKYKRCGQQKKLDFEICYEINSIRYLSTCELEGDLGRKIKVGQASGGKLWSD